MSRILRSLASLIARTGPDCHIVFHHVPKTGGTSIGSAIRERFPLSSAGFDQNAAYATVEALYPDFDRTPLFSDEFLRMRRETFVNHLVRDHRCVAGHFPFDEVAWARFHDRYRFVTVLRDPVKRFVSHYFDSYRPEPDPSRPFAISMSLDELLETERGRRFGRIYAEFYSGLTGRADFDSREAIDRSKANLERFDVVGFLENTDDFVQRLASECGLRIRLEHLRRGSTSKKTRVDTLTPEIVEKIRSMCATDIEIYEWARERFA